MIPDLEDLKTKTKRRVLIKDEAEDYWYRCFLFLSGLKVTTDILTPRQKAWLHSIRQDVEK